MGDPACEVTSDYFDSIVGREFFHLFCGEELGYGVGRVVFAHKGDPTCVIKFETTKGSFQNVMEWDLYEQARGSRLEDWLAPCMRISDSGSILIQKRTKRVPFGYRLPAKVPAIIEGDMKRENWGLYKGRLVCHDYGRHNAVWHAGQLKRVTAQWINAKKGHFSKDLGAVT